MAKLIKKAAAKVTAVTVDMETKNGDVYRVRKNEAVLV
jgi:hypothetical protein